MAARFHRNPPIVPDSENENPFKPAKYNSIPKRTKPALGDITNLTNAPDQPHSNIFKPLHANKIRRNAPSTVKPALPRHRLAQRKPSPMSTTHTAPSRHTDRLNKRAAAAAAAAASISCKLDFATPMKDVHAPHDPLARLQVPADVLDIDFVDTEDPLAVSEFACEIHRNLLQREARFLPASDYMARQQEITVKMRAILIDWLVDVHLKFKLRPESLHLTVSIIDRFLEVQPVLRRKLQLVGVTAMLIACKYEEIYAPEVADFVYISDKAYSKEEILSMEALILNKLRFEVTVPSTLPFMHRCIKASAAATGVDHELHRDLTQYIVDLSLQESVMLTYRPSVRAAAACKLAAKLCNIALPWDATMEFHCGGWKAGELTSCEQTMVQLLEHEQDDQGSNKLTAIKRKFASHRFSSISSYRLDTRVDQPTSMEICAE